jgi:hypothetical protein
MGLRDDLAGDPTSVQRADGKHIHAATLSGIADHGEGGPAASDAEPRLHPGNDTRASRISGQDLIAPVARHASAATTTKIRTFA